MSTDCPVSDTMPDTGSMLNTFTLPLRWLATSIHFPDGWIANPHGLSPPEDVR